MPTLYHFNNSVCSEKVRMVLFEKGVDWESREVDLFKSEQFDPEYLKLNPKGVVPTLVDDGHALTESTQARRLIALHLDRHRFLVLLPDDFVQSRRPLGWRRQRCLTLVLHLVMDGRRVRQLVIGEASNDVVVI